MHLCTSPSLSSDHPAFFMIASSPSLQLDAAYLTRTPPNRSTSSLIRHTLTPPAYTAGNTFDSGVANFFLLPFQLPLPCKFPQTCAPSSTTMQGDVPTTSVPSAVLAPNVNNGRTVSSYCLISRRAGGIDDHDRTNISTAAVNADSMSEKVALVLGVTTML